MRQTTRFIFIFFIAILMTFLAGCGNKAKEDELHAYVNRIKSRTIKEIEPLPEIKPYEPFSYSAFNLRSPFVPSQPEEMPKKIVAESGIHPDVHRQKEALESYPVDSLRMVGTIEKDNKRWALITDPKGTVYRITTGNYVGQNHGRIDDVSDEKIDLTEIIPDPNGGWRERKASIALVDNTKKK